MKKKTRTIREYNPDLGKYEWREVETDKYVFDETDKIAIAREYHELGCPASEIVSKYHISSAVVLYGWLEQKRFNYFLLSPIVYNCVSCNRLYIQMTQQNPVKRRKGGQKVAKGNESNIILI